MKPTKLLLSLLAGLTLAATLPATAQTPAPRKNVVVEADAPFAVFERWVTTVYVATTQFVAPTQPVAFAAPQPSGTPFQPQPVILGLPDWPLAGASAAEAARQWGTQLNYQGLQMRLLVLNPQTGRQELRPIASGLRLGERFKLRLISSFDAVADIDQVVGQKWALQRTTRVYPSAGNSVQLKAGYTMDLPVGASEFFSFDGNPPNERIVVSVRHPQAVGPARSSQPAYRQDGGFGSNYLQLVPPRQFPAIEQVVSLRRPS